jgi:outer membrane protein assembly factor BamB
MTMNDNSELSPRKPLRLWPGVALAILVVLGRYVVPAIAPDAEIFEIPLAIIGILGGMVGAVAIAVWWLFFSRAPWSERVAAIALMIVAELAMRPMVHESVRGGHMGNMLLLYSVPILGLALVAWAVATRGLSNSVRRASLVATIVLACVPFVIIRTAGVIGVASELHWRWTPTPEERLLAEASERATPPGPAPTPTEPPKASVEPPTAPQAQGRPEQSQGATSSGSSGGRTPAAAPDARVAPKSEPTTTEATKADAAPTVQTRAEWPGFRGPNRDGIIRNVRINTDWSASPPVAIWRRPIGPGWSSFAVSGDLLYTQEQRGEDEMVACYRVSTGEPVWRHRDPVRFWESNGGAGPRGTPTLSNGRVYALGATGILNALDAGNGKVLWSRNAATDTGVKVPDWGIASSPLVIDDIVVVAVSGQLVAYDARAGHQRWMGPKGGSGYSSPHLVTIDGVPQILLLRGSRTISVAPADGRLLWEHNWDPGVGIIQPAVTADGDVLITVGDAMGAIGMRRLAASKGPAGWQVEERWTSRGLKPYFNDFVVHKGHAYGFDGSILSCIDLADGARKWKGGRYGNGQLVLLPEQDLLLVVSEEGELALVSATTDGYKELARVPALDGKTWNHPALVGNVLLVRNGEEMAAFRLAPPVAETSAAPSR